MVHLPVNLWQAHRRPGARRLRCVVIAALALAGCTGADGASSRVPAVEDELFTLLPSGYTGVEFENRLTETRDLNVFTYRNFYNGGGVAIGDLTGDGLPELMLTANQGPNRLYLNLGGFRFRDITDEAGVAGTGFWATGATLADVNADGRLDIHVGYAGDVAGAKRANELYIHQGVNEGGVPEFVEAAAEWGIADESYTTHAVFFDYDVDGQLDLYLVNNSFRPVNSFGLRNIRHERDRLGGDKLFRNTGGGFVDVSEQAGIFGSEIGFGLGAAVADLNRDGLPDLYVSNDFFERDYLYMNRGDGTFAEVLDERMPYVSYFSMGLDIADVNNDGWPDIYTTDMLPADDRRLKTTSSFEGWNVYQAKLANGYHHQFMRNMLQLNNADGTFSDIGQMAGVARTDWSWSALVADFDQDGFKDVHVTNGIPRDLTSQDFISFLANERSMAGAVRSGVDFLKLTEAMTSTPVPNHAFRNRGDLTFADASADWGLDSTGFSNGAAYGDLDGDGALDLVVNNINQRASVYRNNARALLDHRYLQVQLEGEGANRFGIGARVTLHSGGRMLVQELMPSRGFQSSVDYVLTFGLGDVQTVDSVVVEWPDRRVEVLEQVPSNQRLVVRQAAARAAEPVTVPSAAPLLSEVTDAVAIDHKHRENAFVDFDRERMIPKLLSTEGPFMAVADVNGDDLDDVFIGGAKDQPGQLLIQRRSGRFDAAETPAFEADRISEDLGAAFFDADDDGDADLYVVSGGNEYSDVAPALQDRLYLNDGRGGFQKATGRLPSESASGSRVAPADFDGDGDVDLFVGGRLVPWRYGLDPQSMLLRNDGRGGFEDVTAEVAPELARVGMVTDAVWRDVDDDGRPDLVVVGEWMPITIFRNTAAGRLERREVPGLSRSNGLWNGVAAGDFTGDGRIDFVVGNLGLNTRMTAAESEPATMHVNDFDGNGYVEQIVSCHVGGTSYPLAMRDEMLAPLSFLKPRFPSYEDYAGKSITEIFSAAELAGAIRKDVYTLATSLARNNGDGSFTLVPLPLPAQVAPVYGIAAADFDRDGALDLLLAGNFDGVEPRIGRMSASYGLYLRGDGDGGFTPVRGVESGFVVPGAAREIRPVRTSGAELYLVSRNDDRPLAFRANR
jgi:hypothetical protein